MAAFDPASGKVLVLGAGHGGVELAASLRQRGFSGAIELLSDEPDFPYQRPPLSKDYIKRAATLVLRPEKFFAEQNISLRLATRAQEIDRGNGRVRLAGGESLAYDHIVIATGARNRRPPIAGLGSIPAYELRTLADARRIVEHISGWRRVAIIGGGFIGLEAAGLLATMGIAVELFELAPRLMQRAVSPTLSRWFQDFHAGRGVRLHMESQVAAVEARGDGIRIVPADGEAIGCDAVILAAGVVPNMELAAAAGLETGNGIVVDSLLKTRDPAISAIGDCAFYPSIHLPGMARLESVQNAVDQARAVAARLTGEALPYAALPWFWSIQGEARLQIAGLSRPDLGEVVRGDMAAGRFSVFLFDEDRLAAVESVNAAGDHMAARRLIAAGAEISPQMAADPAIDLKAMAQAI